MTPDPSAATLRAQLLAVALRCPPLSECDPSEPLRVTLRRGGAKVTLTIRPDAVEAAAHNHLSEIEQAVLAAATKTAQTAKVFVRLTGYSPSRVREAIARLTSFDPPLLIRVHGGIRLP